MGSSGVQVLILNGLVVTLVVLSFLVLRRAPKPPVKLDLRSDGKTPKPKDFLRAVQEELRADIDDKTPTAAIRGKFQDPRTQTARKPVGWDNYVPRNRSVYGGREMQAVQEKSLNIFFNWNGHAWDAYEVLGIPAGASLETALQAFERAKAQADKETAPFLRAAYEAIANTYTLR
ncbi:MAG: hypothetical protein EOP05_03015 [Proteobacteria bacterium]|nr:MAG: hypothetical protein EOP05_03015 [Pseudomonadota bacterium]